GQRQGHDGNRRQNRFDELFTAGSSWRRVRAPAPVDELARAHHGERQLDVAVILQEPGDDVLRRLLPPLGRHEDCRIDQESHGGVSVVSEAMMARRSSPKRRSSWTGTRPRRMSRHWAAVRPFSGGADMRQTSLPCRRTTNRAPVSTLSRIRENDRLAWVADTRWGRCSARARRSDFRAMHLIVNGGGLVAQASGLAVTNLSTGRPRACPPSASPGSCPRSPGGAAE